MLNKSLMIKLLMFTMILVGCASNNVAENEVNDINENPKVQDEKVEDNNSSTITENNEVTEYIEQPQPQRSSYFLFKYPLSLSIFFIWLFFNLNNTGNTDAGVAHAELKYRSRIVDFIPGFASVWIDSNTENNLPNTYATSLDSSFNPIQISPSVFL